MKSIALFFTIGFIYCLAITGCSKADLSNDGLIKSAAVQADGIKSPQNFGGWTISTVTGSDVTGYAGDGGPAKAALLNSPQNVDVDKKGNIYICDLNNNVVRKIDARTGKISTIAGNGIAGYSGDNLPATQTSLNLPFHTVVDAGGNLFIDDLSNHRIRKVNAVTGIMTTYAGTGTDNYNGDGHTAETTDLSIPMGIAFDSHGDLLVSDDAGTRIRRINARTRLVTTIAGNGTNGFSGDGGPAELAALNFAWNMMVDCDGDIFLSDQANYRVRRINGRTGIISTFAGNGIMGNSGIGGLAKNASFTEPVGLATDNNGNIFLSDQALSQIYVINKLTGVIKLVSGNGTNGFSGDGGPASKAILSHPNSLSVGPDGSIYIADNNNNRVRKISGRIF